MAAPFVCGVALLLRDVNPSLTPQAVRSALTSTAVDWGRGGNGKTAGTSGWDLDYGHGRLDAYAAVRAAGGRYDDDVVAIGLLVGHLLPLRTPPGLAPACSPCGRRTPRGL
jgi:serine protease AprX